MAWPRLAELAFRADPAMDLAALAGPVLARLHDATGESVQLYIRSGDKRLCIAARDSGTGLRDSVPVGALLPLAAGSGGKVLLAWAADAGRFTVPAGKGVPADELAANTGRCGNAGSRGVPGGARLPQRTGHSRPPPSRARLRPVPPSGRQSAAGCHAAALRARS